MFDDARAFVLTHGRLLDRLRFAALFEGGEAAPVLAALAAYRHPNGLYGHALEPDKRSPAPQPMDQWEAMRVLREQGAPDGAFLALCDALGPLTCGGGLPFSHPSVTRAPHAPWWACTAPQPPSINPTGGMLAMLYERGLSHPWMGPAEALCWASLEALTEGAHSLANALAFLEHAPDRPRAAAALPALHAMIRAATAFDPAAEGYIFSPLDFAPAPRADGLYSAAELAPHLDRLTAAQQEDGGWPIHWPPLSPAIEAECRARRSIWALGVLRAYGRI